ncbi:MAG TPA: phosphoribosylformylglycinamidine cyclo-ligase [Candidatus Limnocylindrales bacterium]|nr:phosphoribosylformylglycinamidine cyclo-ligase [Candidatus Limnocylindrales bacterium]
MGEGRSSTQRIAYTASGVDVEAGERAVTLMREAVESTRRPEVIGGLGGFGGAISIPPGYRDPVIVSSTDGVGTKTAIAAAMQRWDTIGIDLVAMCADDVVCSGAEPLAFLDYVAVGRLDPEAVAGLVGGVAAGCRDAGCALVGGETAEHPGLLEAGTFDLAGTCLGIAERDDLLDGTQAAAGDLVFGLPSSGLHANGFSLVRSLLAQFAIPLERPYQEQLVMTLGDAGRDAAIEAEPELALVSVGDVLLTPTRIYARRVLDARRALRARGHDLRGVAHVTGGGLPGNVPRVLPSHLGAQLDPLRWTMPSAMWLLAALGGLDEPELRATFNGGLGMTVVVAPAAADLLRQALPEALLVGEIGTVEVLGARYVEGPLKVAA